MKYFDLGILVHMNTVTITNFLSFQPLMAIQEKKNGGFLKSSKAINICHFNSWCLRNELVWDVDVLICQNLNWYKLE